jgi:hypothetical protein
VSFSESYTAVNKKRVVSGSGIFADGDGGVGRKAVVFADNVLFKNIVIP